MLLKNFRLYAITDLKSYDRGLPCKIDEALKGGVDVIQLRSKSLPDKALAELGREIRRITAKRKKLFIVNDRIDLALLLNADGVHLGQDDISTQDAKKLLSRRNIFIGRSTHTVHQALQAQKEGAAYIGFGPLFGTPTKPTYKPIGLNSINYLNHVLKIPFVCIGGINIENVDRVCDAGARRIAVVRAIFDSKKPFEAACRLRERIER